jgi:hypothetical protein
MRLTRPLAITAIALALSGVAFAQPAGPGLQPPPNSNKALGVEGQPPAAAASPMKSMKSMKKTRAQRKADREAAKAAAAANKDPLAAASPGKSPNPGRDAAGVLPPGATKGDAGVAGTGSGTGKP